MPQEIAAIEPNAVSDIPEPDLETKEPFYMLMRSYLPKIEVLKGQYEISGVVKAK